MILLSNPRHWTISSPFIIVWLMLLPVIVLNNLTIVNAQDISESVEEVLQSIQKAVGSIQDYVGDGEGCRFTCPGGE